MFALATFLARERMQEIGPIIPIMSLALPTCLLSPFRHSTSFDICALRRNAGLSLGPPGFGANAISICERLHDLYPTSFGSSVCSHRGARQAHFKSLRIYGYIQGCVCIRKIQNACINEEGKLNSAAVVTWNQCTSQQKVQDRGRQVNPIKRPFSK